MRFIFNFILFGFLYYLLWRFLPQDSFDTIVSWMGKVFEFVQNLVVLSFDKISELVSGAGNG